MIRHLVPIYGSRDLKNRRKHWNAENYRLNRADILARKLGQRRARGIVPRALKQDAASVRRRQRYAGRK